MYYIMYKFELLNSTVFQAPIHGILKVHNWPVVILNEISWYSTLHTTYLAVQISHIILLGMVITAIVILFRE